MKLAHARKAALGVPVCFGLLVVSSCGGDGVDHIACAADWLSLKAVNAAVGEPDLADMIGRHDMRRVMWHVDRVKGDPRDNLAKAERLAKSIDLSASEREKCEKSIPSDERTDLIRQDVSDPKNPHSEDRE